MRSIMTPLTPTKYEYKSIWTCWTQLCTLFGVKTRFWTPKSTSEVGGRISWNFPSTNFSSQRLPRSKLAVLDKKIPNPHAMGHTHTKFEHHPIKTEGALALKWSFLAQTKCLVYENGKTGKLQILQKMHPGGTGGHIDAISMVISCLQAPKLKNPGYIITGNVGFRGVSGWIHLLCPNGDTYGVGMALNELKLISWRLVDF